MTTLVAFSGGGVFFFWELGVLSALPADGRYEWAGASAGAMAAVLAACGVSTGKAFQSAMAIARKNAVFRRRCGAFGIWRALLREWLEELLPPDAAERASGRLTIYVTAVLPCRGRLAVRDWSDREDLIRTVLASCHVPVFMDGACCAPARGCACVDGSAWGGHMAAEHAAGPGQRVLRVDPNDDPTVAALRSAGDWLRAGTEARLRDLYDRGSAFARRKLCL
jgi:hypothetical protein